MHPINENNEPPKAAVSTVHVAFAARLWRAAQPFSRQSLRFSYFAIHYSCSNKTLLRLGMHLGPLSTAPIELTSTNKRHWVSVASCRFPDVLLLIFASHYSCSKQNTANARPVFGTTMTISSIYEEECSDERLWWQPKWRQGGNFSVAGLGPYRFLCMT